MTHIEKEVMEKIKDEPWFEGRDCQYENCASHGCEDCTHDSKDYAGCTYCSDGICQWKQA